MSYFFSRIVLFKEWTEPVLSNLHSFKLPRTHETPVSRHEVINVKKKKSHTSNKLYSSPFFFQFHVQRINRKSIYWYPWNIWLIVTYVIVYYLRSVLFFYDDYHTLIIKTQGGSNRKCTEVWRRQEKGEVS